MNLPSFNGPEWVFLSTSIILAILLSVWLLRRKVRARRWTRMGWWHDDAESLRDANFRDLKRHENDNRNY